MNKDLFPVIVASGTPYEIGLTHGREAKQQIDVSIGTYKAMFWDYSQIKWEDACNYARTFIPTIDEYDPDYMQEIKGIAEGVGYGIDEILALKCAARSFCRARRSAAIRTAAARRSYSRRW